MDAEKRKAESGREHQRKAAAYIAAAEKVIIKIYPSLLEIYNSKVMDVEVKVLK